MIHLESSVPDSGPDSDFDSDSGLYKNLFLNDHDCAQCDVIIEVTF